MKTPISLLLALAIAVFSGCRDGATAQVTATATEPPALPSPPVPSDEGLFRDVAVTLNGQDLQSPDIVLSPLDAVQVESSFRIALGSAAPQYVKFRFLKDLSGETPGVVKDWPAVFSAESSGEGTADVLIRNSDGRYMASQQIEAPDRPGNYSFEVSVFIPGVEGRPAAAVGEVRVVE